MNKQPRKKLIYEGLYMMAEVDVELQVTEDEWSPYLSVKVAYKLDDVRDTLKSGDTATAAMVWLCVLPDSDCRLAISTREHGSPRPLIFRRVSHVWPTLGILSEKGKNR